MAASGACRQIDRCAATGAIHDLDLMPQFFQLFYRQRAYEVLLPQKFKESDETAMVARASEIAESRIALHVLSRPQAIRASGATRACELSLAGGRPLADCLQQSKRRSRSKLETFILVEPERLTLDAQIYGNGPALMALESHCRHFCGAVGTIHAGNEGGLKIWGQING